MQGRKPKPNAVKLLSGSKYHNKREPNYPKLDPTTPEELTSEIARAEWDRLAQLMIASGHVSTVDRSTLLAYCEKYGQWRVLESAADAAPMTTKSPKSGWEIPHPLRGMANQSFVLMLRAAVELGITPSSRSKVIAAPVAPPESKWSALLAG